MTLPIRYDDDGKGKWQSVSATLSIGDELANIYIMDWGRDELEAEEKLMAKFNALAIKVGWTNKSDVKK